MKKAFTLDEIYTILLHVLEALVYLHARRWMHRDIKTTNMLVSRRHPPFIKLSDFGCAREDQGGLRAFKTRVGTPGFWALEVWEKGTYSFAGDIWSLGMVAVDLLLDPTKITNAFPCGCTNPTSWTVKVCDIVKIESQGTEHKVLMNFVLTKMLRLNPKDRKSASECHEEISSIQQERRQRLERRQIHLSEPAVGLATPTPTPHAPNGAVCAPGPATCAPVLASQNGDRAAKIRSAPCRASSKRHHIDEGQDAQDDQDDQHEQKTPRASKLMKGIDRGATTELDTPVQSIEPQDGA